MVLRTVSGVVLSEDVDDLRTYLLRLQGPEPLTEVAVLACARHEEERPTWTYVEADAAQGLARRRCLKCAETVHLLDSEQRWAHPPMWMCPTCSQSIAEVAVGLAVADGEHVTWAAVIARCVECGRVEGLTDMVLPGTALPEVLAGL